MEKVRRLMVKRKRQRKSKNEKRRQMGRGSEKTIEKIPAKRKLLPVRECPLVVG